MSKLINFINETTNNAYTNIKVVSVVYAKNNNLITVKFVYDKNKPELTEQDKTTLNALVKQYVGEKVEVEIKYKKALIDEDSVTENVANFVLKNYANVFSMFDKKFVEVLIQDDSVYIKIGLLQVLYDYLKNKNFENELVKYLCSNYFETFSVETYEVKDNSLSMALQEHVEQKVMEVVSSNNQKKLVFYDVENVEPLFGELKDTHVNAISNISEACESIKIAGQILFPNIREFKSKRLNENGEAVMKQFLSFTLADAYGKISCVFFPTKNDVEKLKDVVSGQQVIVLGDVEIFNEKLNFKIKQMSNCTVQLEKKKDDIVLKTENENYIYVKPEEYINLTQSSIFDIFEKPVNDYLKNNVIVCFDLETTGLDASVNEIIEIGAVKIINGKITETFSCLVKPKGIIDETITNITGITNDMVKNCYSIEQVLPDFYKFSRGAVLVAHNINFDYNFINIVGNKNGYKFDNLQQDTLYLARTYIKGLKNYKLKTVADKLSVSLENAHRAVHDAIAAAEIFIKLTEYFSFEKTSKLG